MAARKVRKRKIPRPFVPPAANVGPDTFDKFSESAELAFSFCYDAGRRGGRAGDIERWLEALGLTKYRDAFVANEISFGDLSELMEGDLKELGLPIGPRRRALKAIAESGAQIPMPSIAGPAAERRQLTVMFCDLVGSTALSRRLDPEDLRDVMRRYQDSVAGAVTRYGGHIAK